MGTSDRLYRRSRTLVVYWREDRLVGRDYALNVERPLSDRSMAVLSRLSQWTSAADLRRSLGARDARTTGATLGALRRFRFVEAADERPHDTRERLASWASWTPAAAFFHFSTKDGRRIGLEAASREIEARIDFDPYPDTLKTDPAAKRVSLPSAKRRGIFPKVLLSRRSWRRFGRQPLSTSQLSTLLGLTWGVQRWMRISPEIRSALKTSPSGGACHSLEVYVVAQHVRGLPKGIYHYCPDSHDLELVRSSLPAGPIVKYLGGQPWYADCSALFIITSVVARVQWKYAFPRAYRTLLLEAGHFAQTFCLLATSMGLAPFCTGAFADSIIERALRVDGVDEPALYVTGVGSRPPGAVWAPWPSAEDTPQIESPTHTRIVRRSSNRR